MANFLVFIRDVFLVLDASSVANPALSDRDRSKTSLSLFLSLYNDGTRVSWHVYTLNFELRLYSTTTSSECAKVNSKLNGKGMEKHAY